MYTNSQNRMRMRMYNCFNDIKLHQRFVPVVSPPSQNKDMKPHVVRLKPQSHGSFSCFLRSPKFLGFSLWQYWATILSSRSVEIPSESTSVSRGVDERFGS